MACWNDPKASPSLKKQQEAMHSCLATHSQWAALAAIKRQQEAKNFDLTNILPLIHDDSL